MKERPILFSAPMVRAILTDQKTITRRLVKPQPPMGWFTDECELQDPEHAKWLAERCPYGIPGDRLWVRETHAQFAVGNRTGVSPQCVAYRATCDEDGGFDYVNNGDEIMRLKVTKWTPAIFMPRWACRLELEVTGVRVERLQAITEEDARAEGVERDTEPCDHTRASCDEIGCMGPTYRSSFAELWEKINGTRAPWASNPWVWVVAFKRVELAGSAE